MNRFQKVYPQKSMGEVVWKCQLASICVDTNGSIIVMQNATYHLPNSGAVEQFSEALVQAQNFGLAFRFLIEHPEIRHWLK